MRLALATDNHLKFWAAIQLPTLPQILCGPFDYEHDAFNALHTLVNLSGNPPQSIHPPSDHNPLPNFPLPLPTLLDATYFTTTPRQPITTPQRPNHGPSAP